MIQKTFHKLIICQYITRPHWCMRMHKCIGIEEEHNIQMKRPGVCLVHEGGKTLSSFGENLENSKSTSIERGQLKSESYIKQHPPHLVFFQP